MYNLYLFITFILTLFYTKSIKGKHSFYLCKGQHNSFHSILFIIAIVYAVFIGLRPIDGGYGDTPIYAEHYNNINYISKTNKREFGFTFLMQLCYPLFNASGFFVIVALGYYLCTAYSMKKLLKYNDFGGFLLFIGAFSAFTYATNGIRNGLACSILTIAIVIVSLKQKITLIIPILLSLVALAIHKSTILPIICLIGSVYLRNNKFPFYFWLFSILVFLTFGNTVGNILSTLGFDDRMSNYLKNTASYGANYKTGFRPDFLLYSAMPIVLGYYIIFKKKLRDRTYEILLNTYIFSNAVWVMIMNISFSNRFAYLSWFLYPIVLAYPCLKMNIWDKFQGKYASWIILANILFTIFMQFIYYS